MMQIPPLAIWHLCRFSIRLCQLIMKLNIKGLRRIRRLRVSIIMSRKMGGHIINTRRAVSIVLTLLQFVRLTELVEYLLPNDEVSLKKGRLSTLTMFI